MVKSTVMQPEPAISGVEVEAGLIPSTLAYHMQCPTLAAVLENYLPSLRCCKVKVAYVFLRTGKLLFDYRVHQFSTSPQC